MSVTVSMSIVVDTGGPEPFEMSLGERTVTHNLTPMWREAGVYCALYESEGSHAGSWLDTLDHGIAEMERHPEVYLALNPSNGWGDAESALKFLREWRDLCARHPKSLVKVDP